MAQLLKEAVTAIHNTQSDETLAALAAKSGYPEERVVEGRALLDDATIKVAMAAAARSAKREATREVRESQRALQDAVSDMAAIAQVLFAKEQGVLTALRLKGPLPRTQSEMALVAMMLFDLDTFPASASPRLEAHGFGVEKRQEGVARLDAFHSAQAAQLVFHGDQKMATEDQQEAMQKLRVWLAAFIKIMRVTLRERPELLLKLGVVVRVEKTPAQRAGPAKATATRRRNRASQLLLAVGM